MPNNARRRTDPRYRAGRNGAALEARKAHVYATETECHATVCLNPAGRTVNMHLRYPHPWSKSFGHSTELDRETTDPLDGHLEHLRCNTSAGAAYGNRKRAGTLPTGLDTTFDWS